MTVSAVGYPDDNPKSLQGALKCPLHLVPPAAMIAAARGLEDGAKKYGAYNFRDTKIALSVYYGAFLRHVFAYWDGEDVASDSKLLHLDHMIATLSILIDALNKGNLIDDRPTKGAAPDMLLEYHLGKKDGS